MDTKQQKGVSEHAFSTIVGADAVSLSWGWSKKNAELNMPLKYTTPQSKGGVAMRRKTEPQTPSDLETPPGHQQAHPQPPPPPSPPTVTIPGGRPPRILAASSGVCMIWLMTSTNGLRTFWRVSELTSEKRAPCASARARPSSVETSRPWAALSSLVPTCLFLLVRISVVGKLVV